MIFGGLHEMILAVLQTRNVGRENLSSIPGSPGSWFSSTQVSHNAGSWEFMQYALDPECPANTVSRPVYFPNAAILKLTTFRFAAGRTEHN